MAISLLRATRARVVFNRFISNTSQIRRSNMLPLTLSNVTVSEHAPHTSRSKSESGRHKYRLSPTPYSLAGLTFALSEFPRPPL